MTKGKPGVFARIKRVFQKAVPGPKEIERSTRDHLMAAAEQLDPAESDPRVVAPEERPTTQSEPVAKPDHER